MDRNLITRIIVAVIAIPLILWVCYEGGLYFFSLIALFTLVAAVEMLFNENFKPTQFSFYLLLVVTLAMALSSMRPPVEWMQMIIEFNDNIPILLIVFMVSSILFAVGTKPIQTLYTKQVRLLWGVFYVGLLYPYVYLAAEASNLISGGDWMLFLFATLWVTDSSAMFVGKGLGRHKLAPAVSPNKTVEGFAGGIMGGLLVSAVLYLWKMNEIPLHHVLLMAAGISFFGQLGDLVESLWKRSLNIKDSSAIIPGHGGILDRFDSLLFAAPYLYYYKMLILT